MNNLSKLNDVLFDQLIRLTDDHEGYGKQAPEVRRALINVVRLEQAAKRVA